MILVTSLQATPHCHLLQRYQSPFLSQQGMTPLVQPLLSGNISWHLTSCKIRKVSKKIYITELYSTVVY